MEHSQSPLPIVIATEPVLEPVVEPELDNQSKGTIATWRYWIGTAVVLIAVWTVLSVMAGEPVFFWPVFPLSVWGSVLLASTIWARGNQRRSIGP